ncbi:uroporphyrinogen decarboxylase [Alkalispirochaeta americana]|uniref:Uroporphyrinogen decarboxylase n=1 Tax=Alkalispirochaeta americana TaxID=159291 RepID=A0A1N6XXJ1_9SPIO|nr:uroporphyrinogen decarboxylase family protein [Alkalispirochaeta americana]SIR06953.1 uroporphyrinogen decarboxylase [Alkalispirochaeta americana]
MTKKQRVAALICGEEVDRIPASFSLHFSKESVSGKKAIDAHREFFQETDVDVLKIMNENLFSPDVLIRSPEDWKHIRPITGKEVYIQNQLDIIKALSDEMGGDAYIFATIHGVFASAFHATKDDDMKLAHHDKVTAHLRESPDVIETALKNIAEGLVAFVDLCIEAGAEGIYYAALGAESYRFTRDEFSRYIKPNDILVLEAAKKAPGGTILHMCKDRLNIDLYKGYPCDIVNWAVNEQNISLDEGRELFKKPVLGGFDDRAGVLVEGRKRDIEHEVHRLVNTYGPTNFMLGADCTLPENMSYERIRWAVDALQIAKMQVS